MLDMFGDAETALEALMVFRYNKTIWCRHIGSKLYTGDGEYYLSVLGQYFKTIEYNKHLFDIGATILERLIIDENNMTVRLPKLKGVKAAEVDWTKLEQFGFTANRDMAFKPCDDNWWGTLLLPINGSANKSQIRYMYPSKWVDPFEHKGIKAHCSTLGDYVYVNYLADAFARRVYLLPSYSYRASLADGITVLLVLMSINNPELYEAMIDYLNEAYSIGDSRDVMVQTKREDLLNVIGTTITTKKSMYSSAPAKTGVLTTAGLELYYKSAGLFMSPAWEFDTWGGDAKNWRNFYSCDTLSASGDSDNIFVMARKFDTLPWGFTTPLATYRNPIFASPRQVAPLYK